MSSLNLSFYQDENLFAPQFDKRKSHIDLDEPVSEKDKKFPPPPSYFKDFTTAYAKSPPDLTKLSKKDYFILY